MKRLRHLPIRAPRRAGARGFTLVEMLVAMSVGLVMVGGFAMMFVNMKQTFRSQDDLGALQDNERVAMSVINTAVQQAGYFPSPLTTDRGTQILASTDSTYGTWVAGRSMFGTAASGSTPESFQTAFTAAPNDTLLNCQGGGNTGATNVTYRNIFVYDATNGTLKCKVLSTSLVAGSPVTTDSGWQNLVGNVRGMTMAYGVASASTDGAIDAYMTVSNSSLAANWDKIKAIRVTLTLTTGTSASAPTVSWVHTINLMNQQ